MATVPLNRTISTFFNLIFPEIFWRTIGPFDQVSIRQRLDDDGMLKLKFIPNTVCDNDVVFPLDFLDPTVFLLDMYDALGDEDRV